MESLKKFEEICEKDIRQDSFVIFDSTQPGNYRRHTLKDIYQRAERIRLHDGVPDKIRSHFETARNLVVYSWFYYPFNVTAQLCAYTSVEYALRVKAGNPSRRPSFRKLLKMAVEQNWIRDESFSHVKRKHENLRASNEGIPAEFQIPESELAQEYCKRMIEALPFLRNTLAHGSTMLHNHGAKEVSICADLINQLFPNPSALVASLKSNAGEKTNESKRHAKPD